MNGSTTETTKHPVSLQLRIKFVLTGVVYPLVAFSMSLTSPPVASSPWQSGKLQDYVAMLMTFPGFGPFLPLVLFSMVGLTFWLFDPGSGRFPVIVLGIVTGPLIATQFLIMTMITAGPFPFFFAAITAPIQAAIVYAIFGVWSHSGKFTIRYLLIVTAVFAMIAAAINATESWSYIAVSLAGCLFYAAASSPVLCLVTYVRAAVYLYHQQACKDAAVWVWMTFLVTWLITWMASWKFAVDIMMREYAKLPTGPPQCYVCSSAAHGHRRLVGSQPRPGDGVLVNSQMRRLKFFEFAIAAALPKLHRSLRRVYDHVGPPLARVCASNRLFADAIYLALKPIELAAIVVATLARFHGDSIDKLYQR